MTVKIGMIGAGGIARHHLGGLQRIPLAEIVSVYDVSPDNAASMADIVGAKVADSVEALLDPEQIDAVFICSPQFARGDIEELAARKGIHMLVEKPLGLELASVQRKAQVIRESGVIHSVGYCLRYFDTVQQAKTYLEGKTIHLVQAHRFGGSHPAPWWRQQSMSGGHLADAVTHQVDMIRYLAGEYRSVSAMFGNNSIRGVYPDATIADGGAVSFTLESGAVGTITESCVSPHHGLSDIKFFGADFFVHIGNNGQVLTIVDNDQHVTIYSKLDPTYEQDKAFIEAVAASDRQGVLCGYEDGMGTLAFTLAAHQSAAERGFVELGRLGE